MIENQPTDRPRDDERERELFLAALEIGDPAAREAWLEKACGGDPLLLARVRELLKAEADSDSFLDPGKERLAEAAAALAGQAAGDLSEPVTLPDDGREIPSPERTRSTSEGPGDVIGRYRLLQRIGEGGGGVVYLADQTEPVKRKVALKIIKLGMDTKQVVARFEAERQALAMMDHPHIAKVFDAGATASGRPYFVMELVRGVPITRFCDENKLNTKERLEIFIQVCEAVQHAHQKGVIHRDLKPGNILVTMLEDRPSPKVIDFGVAKASQQALTEKTFFTQHGHFIGTPAYMSPEQAQMTGYDIDTRSDIYALGVLLYELLTGKTPFDTTQLLKAGYNEICRVLAEDEPSKPSTRFSSLWGADLAEVSGNRRAEPRRLSRLLRGDLDWIVMKALEKDRRRRYETANGFAADVRRFLNQEPISAGPPDLRYKVGKFARRHKAALSVGVAIAALLVASTAVSLWQASQTEKERLKVERAKSEVEREKRLGEQLFSRNDEQQGLRALYDGDQAMAIAHLARAIRTDPGNETARFRLLSAVTLGDQNGAVAPLPLFQTPDDIVDELVTDDGLKLVTVSRDGVLRGWDLRTGDSLFNPIPTGFEIDGGLKLMASPDGKRLLVASKEGRIRLLDLDSGEELIGPVRLGRPGAPPVSGGAGGEAAAQVSERFPPRVYLAPDGGRFVAVVPFITEEGVKAAEERSTEGGSSLDVVNGRVRRRLIRPPGAEPGSPPAPQWTPDRTLVQVWALDGPPSPLEIEVTGHIEDAKVDRTGTRFCARIRQVADSDADAPGEDRFALWALADGKQLLPEDFGSQLRSDEIGPTSKSLIFREGGRTVLVWPQEKAVLGGDPEVLLAPANHVVVFDLDAGSFLEPPARERSSEISVRWDVAAARKSFIKIPWRQYGGIFPDVQLDDRGTVLVSRPHGLRRGSPGSIDEADLWDLRSGARLPGLGGDLGEVLLSPDGGLVIAQSGQQLHYWETGETPETGVRLDEVTGFSLAVHGEAVATAHVGGRVEIRDREGLERVRFYPFGRGVGLARSIPEDPWTEKPWEPVRRRVVLPPQSGSRGRGRSSEAPEASGPSPVRFGAGGNTLLVWKCTENSRMIGAWDVRERAALPRLAKLEGKPAKIDPYLPRLIVEPGSAGVDPGSPVVISPGGDRVALVFDGAVHVYDSERGTRLGSPLAPPEREGAGNTPPVQRGVVRVKTGAFDDNDRRLALSYDDRSVRVWDLSSGTFVALEGDSDITALIFERGHEKLWGASRQGEIIRWDLVGGTRTKVEAAPWEGRSELRPVWGGGAGEDGGGHVLLVGGGVVGHFDRRTGQQSLLRGQPFESECTGAAFSWDGLVGAAGTANGMLHVWSGTTGKNRFPPVSLDASIGKVALDHGGLMVATATGKNIVRLWDTRRGEALTPALAHPNEVLALSISADGSRLTTVDADLCLRSWRLFNPEVSPPSWFLALCESLGGQRFDGEGNLVPVGYPAFQEEVSRLAGNASGDDYSGLGRWLTQTDAARPVAPGADVTVPRYIESLLAAGGDAEIAHGMRIDPGNPRLKARRAIQEGATRRGTWLFGQAVAEDGDALGAATLVRFANRLLAGMDGTTRAEYEETAMGYVDLALQRVQADDDEVWQELNRTKYHDPSRFSGAFLQWLTPRKKAEIPASPLSENIVVRWHGTAPGGVPVDLEQTGCGPVFKLDVTLAPDGDDDGDPPLAPFMTGNVVVHEAEAGYLLEFSLGLRVAVKDGPNIHYHSQGLRGSTLAEPGVPVVVFEEGGNPLMLTVSEPGRSGGPPRGGSSIGYAATAGPSGEPLLTPLEENLTLHFNGKFKDLFDLDVKLHGCGPEYSANFHPPGATGGADDEFPLPDEVRIEAYVSPAGEGYRVEFGVGARIPVDEGEETVGAWVDKRLGRASPPRPTPVTQGGPGMTVRNIYYRDEMLVGAAMLKAGESHEILDADGQPGGLTLTLTADR